QLETASEFANWIGGGTTWNPISGVFAAPTFQVQGQNYNTVYSAIEALNTGLSTALTAAGTPGPAGPQGPVGPQGATGATGAAGTSASDNDAGAVKYDTTTSGAIDTSQVALQGNGGTTIHNLAAGQAPTDAANVSQVQQALAEANSFTTTSISN
ncbi:hypothetical protein B1B_08991, partial [mine drainage metagenome]